MPAEPQSREELKEKFHEAFRELVASKETNAFYMDNAAYKAYLDSVKAAKEAKSKTPLQYRRLKRFDVIVVDGTERLISPLGPGEKSVMRFFVRNEEMFDILHETHLRIRHGGKNRMKSELNKRYKNITNEVIMVYLRLCIRCQEKLASRANNASNNACNNSNSGIAGATLDANKKKAEDVQPNTPNEPKQYIKYIRSPKRTVDENETDSTFRSVHLPLEVNIKTEYMEEQIDNRTDEIAKRKSEAFSPSEKSLQPKRFKETQDVDVQTSHSSSTDDCSIFGEYIASKLRGLDPLTRSRLEHKINILVHESEIDMLQARYSNLHKGP